MEQTYFHQVSLSLFDWSAVVVYLSLTAAIALWATRGQKGGEGYFLAGRSMGWIVISIAVFATLFSSISFVATPGEAYKNGLMLATLSYGQILFMPLAIWLFLRFFFLTPTFTAYEYLERRFSLPMRLIGSAMFMLVRLLYSGVVYYAAARLFESLVGWHPLLTITAVGLFTVAYTVTGGMKATILTDVMQTIVLFVGISVLAGKVLSLSGYDLGAIYQYASERNHGFEAFADPRFYRIHWQDRLNFWILLMHSVLTPLVSFSADQLVVQRLLASKGYKGAVRASVSNYFVGIPVGLMLWLTGIGLFYFYGTQPQKLAPGVGPDHILGYFIHTEMPSPIPGLLVAALLAALMSTVSSVVNSLATVAYRDWLVRLRWTVPGGRNEMLLARLLSAGMGLAGIGIAAALVLASEGITSSVFEISGIWANLWIVLTMAFLLGVLVPRVSGPAMLGGVLAGGAVNLYLPYAWYYAIPAEERISFMWLSYPGMLLALGVPLLLCLVLPNRKDLKGLTLWTLEKRSEPAPGPALEAQAV